LECSERTASTPRMFPWSSVFLAGVILLGFVLRIYRLDTQSLWGDEGWAVYHSAQGSAARVIAEAYHAGNHPPLYFLTLAFWMDVAGRSEFALRYLSLLFSVLSVPAIAVLGRRVGGWRVGALAALLQAAAPYAVYYGQEARMYAQMALFAVLSTYFFLRLYDRAERPWLVGGAYVVTTSIACYSHLFAWPVVFAQGLYWLGDLLLRRWAVWEAAKRCITAQAAAVIAFVPWFVYAWDRLMGVSSQVEPMSIPLQTIVMRCLSDFSAGVPVIAIAPTDQPLGVLLPFLLLLALGLIWPWRWRLVPLLALGLLVPVVVIFAVSFPTLPGWTRYFIAASSFYYLLLARGADGLGRLAEIWVRRTHRKPGMAGRTVWPVVLPALLILPVLGFQARTLLRYYNDPAYYRWDYRARGGELAEAAAAGDAVVLQGKAVMFEYYFPPELPYYEVPAVCNSNEDGIRSEIAEITSEHEAVWVVGQRPSNCDPNARAAQWLKENAYQVSEEWLESTIFDYYLTPRSLPVGVLPEKFDFDGQFELIGYALSREAVEPGEALAVALKWRAIDDIALDYKVFLVMVGPSDTVYALRDGMPLNWLWPTSRWEPGETVDDRWGLQVEDGTPPGTYPLYVGAYDPGTGQRLVVTADGDEVGDRVLLGNIVVE